MIDHDRPTMRIALDAAQAAADAGEIPVGAAVFDPAANEGRGEVISVCGNASVSLHDPTAHAEIRAIREAAQKRGNYRLTGLWLYVTLEPCAMCAGAISQARIGRVVFGASDPKGGGVVHGAKVFDQPTCHWRPEILGGVLGEESAAMLKGFFKARRIAAAQVTPALDRASSPKPRSG